MMQLNQAHNIVIKIGSHLLLDEATSEVRTKWLASLVEDITALHAKGVGVVLVSSGAVALGRGVLEFSHSPLKLEEKQAAAACGQTALMQAWREALAPHDIKTAQILLTLEDSENRRRYLNAKTTLDLLLKLGIIPIVNENDTVATTELKVGDNDRLAARVAQMISADALVLLSDVDGLYTANPDTNLNAEHIDIVESLSDEIMAMAGISNSSYGTGGMITKLEAAAIAMQAGCNMAIMCGVPQSPLQAVEQGAKCTWFIANGDARTARKDWIAGSLKPQGELVVDDGAAKALASGKSLLPVGILKISGDFQRGDAVLVLNQRGEAIAKGLVAYALEDANKIIGKKIAEIEDIVGFKGRNAIIHRDDLVVL